MSTTLTSIGSLLVALLTIFVQLVLAILRLVLIITEIVIQALSSGTNNLSHLLDPLRDGRDLSRAITNPSTAADQATDASPVSLPTPPVNPPTVVDHQQAANHPIPFICDAKTMSRKFYVVTVGRQVGVFDNR
jgi:hypothetical protein